MPTTKKRHMVTETEPVARALEIARAAANRPRRDSELLTELIVRGAKATIALGEQREAEDRERLELRERFLQRRPDIEALAEVGRTGWVRD